MSTQLKRQAKVAIMSDEKLGNMQVTLYHTVRDNIVMPHRMMVEEELRRHVNERVDFQILNKVYSQI